MATAENSTTSDTIRLTTETSTTLLSLTMQNYIGVWFVSNQTRDAHASIERALRGIFNSFEIISQFDKCIAYIAEPRPAKIFFIVPHKTGQHLVPLLLDANPSSIKYIYIHCTSEEEQNHWHSHGPEKIRGGYRDIKSLIEQIKSDTSTYNERMSIATSLSAPLITIPDDANSTTISANESTIYNTFYAVPSTMVLDKNLKNTAIKDLSEDYVWFIHFQILVEILIRLNYSEKTKEDIISICRDYYKNDIVQQRKIDQFEKEANDISRSIYWYTANSFIVHLLNEVCGTEDVDHLFDFRLIISNLHRRILELENDLFTIDLKIKRPILYRGKRMATSTLENFRKSIGSIVAMKGFLSTTSAQDVAELFAGGGIEQTGTVCVLFKLNIRNWEECKPSAAIRPEDSAIKDEDEVLFSMGSIWKIDTVRKFSDSEIWWIELTSCPESDVRSIELTNYLREQLGDTSNLWTLADFLMKIGKYKKAEKYYRILERNLNPTEKHVDRAKIYNRLGIIRREEGELELAIDYFQRAVDTAPPESDIATTADYNMQTVQTESEQAPTIFLGRRIASSDVISKPLVTNEISIPISKNNSGYAAYRRGQYDEAILHYKTALSTMKASKLFYLHEISCVYNNLGAVSYDQQDYTQAKDYFQEAIFTLQEFTLNHPWLAEYKHNLKCAQQKITKRQKT